jgi:hypothetical protein
MVELLKKHMQERAPAPAARSVPSRIPCLLPPQYNIDAILDVDLTGEKIAFDALEKFWEAIDELPPGVHYRPDTALLWPELMVRDLCRFDVSMGNGFAASLSYGGGFQIFFRALRALRVIKHRRALALVEAVRDVMVANGAREPSRFPDDLYEGCDVDWEEEVPDMRELDRNLESMTKTKALDDQWFDISHNYGDYTHFAPEDPSLHQGICQYLSANRELLRCRKVALP